MADPVSPMTTLRQALKTVMLAEFSTEGFPVKDDRLHDSIGENGPMAGISPEGETLGGSPDGTYRVLVQVHGRFKADIPDPKQSVDPAPIEAWAFRFEQAVQGQVFVLGELWYFNVIEVTYPEDPTGNKTRFEALVEGHGNNSTVIKPVS